MGRIGYFIGADNAGASETEMINRDRLAHELMYFSRGNPVIYYGDEQGFTGTGGDQVARQSMFASQVPDYLDDDLLGTSRTHAQDNFVPSHPLYQQIRQLARLTKQHPALRNGAHQHRYGSTSAGIYAFSRILRDQQYEYVVALNNSESAKTAAIPTYVANGAFTKVYGSGREPTHHQRQPPAVGRRAGAVHGGLQVGSPDPARGCGAGDLAEHPAGLRGQLADAGVGQRGRLIVQRGHLLRPGAGWRLAAYRHRRHSSVPGLPRRQRRSGRQAGGLPSRGSRQRRPHPGQCPGARDRAEADSHLAGRRPRAPAYSARSRSRSFPTPSGRTRRSASSAA